MSSSFSSTISKNNKLKNNYCFYGTHPLKVPNARVHTNATDSLSKSIPVRNSTNLSLHLTNSNQNNFHRGYSLTTDITTTKSLYNLNASQMDDDNSEVRKEKTNKEKDILFTLFYHLHMSLSK